MRRIVFDEIGPHEGDVLGRAQLLGQSALDEAHDAVADERAILLVGVLRKAPQGQHGVAGDGQVADRVEQRAVEVENHELGSHVIRSFWSPGGR